MSKKWTNKSVLALAENGDPVQVLTQRVREKLVSAIDAGWQGPPYDPIKLAEQLGISVTPNDEVRDARIVPFGPSKFRVEFNPGRSRRRVRYSIAHEIAHTFFPDCSEEVRHRAAGAERGLGDEWQLEALCNIAAAEILMPVGSLPAISVDDANVDRFLEIAKLYDVSNEATFIRLVQVTSIPCAMFCASRVSELTERHRVDYMIGSRTWPIRVQSNELPVQSVASHCTSVGYTWKGDELWRAPGSLLHVECVGIAPYPGSGFPRVIGIVTLPGDDSQDKSPIVYVNGDATVPRGGGPKLIAHVVNDKTQNWGGRGFAKALARRHPEVQQAFRAWASGRSLGSSLGEVHIEQVSPEVSVASMVSQHGYGPSQTPRIRYAYLRACLELVASVARRDNASVHMPRIGCGEAGGSWEVVEELIHLVLSSAGVPVTVYDLPDSPVRPGTRSDAFRRR